jgi:glutamate synthase domain-containing protein 3
MAPGDIETLRGLLDKHRDATGSARATQILADWDSALPHFVKVISGEYKRLLAQRQRAQAERQDRTAGRDMPTRLPVIAA